MADERCERCDMLWCDCPADGSVPRADHRRNAPGAPWAGWPEGAAVIISNTGYAHRRGCSHLTASTLTAPQFGWVAVPVSGHHITDEQPLRATAGNTARVATTPCPTCFE
ncbi:hypothetical protein ACGFZP_38565 [Kitasatospora sp. NPDC048239]|uniref:hypothetical protein n=1 Tax=Kitasatospora sp. NPDC048239 TaxID=3364046 RepID=UPI0037123E04